MNAELHKAYERRPMERDLSYPEWLQCVVERLTRISGIVLDASDEDAILSEIKKLAK